MSIEVTSDVQWDWPLQHNDEFVQVHDTPTFFEVGLDAKYFTPKEIQVKAIGDMLQIRMEHEARTNALGDITRSIMRCYKVPKDVDMKTLKSNLDSTGILRIRAEKNVKE